MPDETGDDNADEKHDEETGKEPFPDDIEEKTRGHPDEDWTGIYDKLDPTAGREPYPDDIKGDETDASDDE